MSVDCLSTDAFLERVLTLCPTYASVQEALTSVQVAKSGQFRSPGAFVLEPAETPFGQPNGSGRLIQMVVAEVGVLTGILSVRDVLDREATAQLRKVRNELRTAIIGWLPDGGRTSTEFMPGISRPFGFDEDVGAYWFLDSFQLTRRLTADIQV